MLRLFVHVAISIAILPCIHCWCVYCRCFCVFLLRPGQKCARSFFCTDVTCSMPCETDIPIYFGRTTHTEWEFLGIENGKPEWNEEEIKTEKPTLRTKQSSQKKTSKHLDWVANTTPPTTSAKWSWRENEKKHTDEKTYAKISNGREMRWDEKAQRTEHKIRTDRNGKRATVRLNKCCICFVCVADGVVFIIPVLYI